MGSQSLGDLWPELHADDIGASISEYQFEKRLSSSSPSEKSKQLVLDVAVQGIDRSLIILRDIKVSNLSSDFRLVAALKLIVTEVKRSPKAIKNVMGALKGAFTVCDAFVKTAALPVLAQLSSCDSSLPADTLLPWLIHSLENVPDTDDMKVWQSTILDFAKVVSPKVLIEQIWKLAQTSAWMTERLETRTFSCELLSAIANRSATGDVHLPDGFLDAIKGALTDIHDLVRQSAALPACQALLLPVLRQSEKQAIMDLLCEIITSSCSASVIGEVVVQLVEIFPHCDKGIKQFFSRPFLDVYRSLSFSDASQIEELQSLMKSIGAVIYYCHSFYEIDEIGQYLKVVLAMATTAEDVGPIISATPRYFVAYNFPAIATGCYHHLTHSLQEGHAMPQTVIGKCVSLFHSASTHSMLRATFASGFHEVMVALGAPFCLSSSGLGALMSLLVDSDVRVVLALSEHFDAILRCCVGPSSASRSAVLKLAGPYKKAKPGTIPSCVLQRVLAAAGRLQDHWRQQRALFSAILASQAFMSENDLQGMLLLQTQDFLLRDSLPEPVARVLCNILASLALQCRSPSVRMHIIEWATAELLDSPLSKKRILFLYFCQNIPSYFSRAFFKEFLYEPVLSLAVDPVLDVRRRLCDFLPVVKAMLILPKDHNLHRMFEGAVGELPVGIKDNDFWKAYAKETSAALDAIETPITWDASNVFDDYTVDKLREDDEEAVAKLEGEKGDKEKPRRRKQSGVGKMKRPMKSKSLAKMRIPQVSSAQHRGSLDTGHSASQQHMRTERRRSSLFPQAQSPPLLKKGSLPIVHEANKYSPRPARRRSSESRSASVPRSAHSNLTSRTGPTPLSRHISHDDSDLCHQSASSATHLHQRLHLPSSVNADGSNNNNSSSAPPSTTSTPPPQSSSSTSSGLLRSNAPGGRGVRRRSTSHPATTLPPPPSMLSSQNHAPSSNAALVSAANDTSCRSSSSGRNRAISPLTSTRRRVLASQSQPLLNAPAETEDAFDASHGYGLRAGKMGKDALSSSSRKGAAHCSSGDYLSNSATGSLASMVSSALATPPPLASASAVREQRHGSPGLRRSRPKQRNSAEIRWSQNDGSGELHGTADGQPVTSASSSSYKTMLHHLSERRSMRAPRLLNQGRSSSAKSQKQRSRKRVSQCEGGDVNKATSPRRLGDVSGSTYRTRNHKLPSLTSHHSVHDASGL